jgi:signal transduction histidine kinase
LPRSRAANGRRRRGGQAIAKEILNAHGESIRAESGLGAGSTFIFMLQRADPVAAKEVLQ